MPRFAICTPNFGTYADPQIVVRLARSAESAGWDGYFIGDHLSFVRRSSVRASRSGWVGTEPRAFVERRAGTDGSRTAPSPTA